MSSLFNPCLLGKFLGPWFRSIVGLPEAAFLHFFLPISWPCLVRRTRVEDDPAAGGRDLLDFCDLSCTLASDTVTLPALLSCLIAHARNLKEIGVPGLLARPVRSPRALADQAHALVGWGSSHVASPLAIPSRSLGHPGPGDPEMLDTPVPCSVALLTVATCLCSLPALGGWSTAPGLLCTHVGGLSGRTANNTSSYFVESVSSTLQPHTHALLGPSAVSRRTVQTTCSVRPPTRYPMTPLSRVQLHDPPEGGARWWPEARHQSSRHFTSLLAMLTDIGSAQRRPVSQIANMESAWRCVVLHAGGTDERNERVDSWGECRKTSQCRDPVLARCDCDQLVVRTARRRNRSPSKSEPMQGTRH
jgi:hypothetical protein